MRTIKKLNVALGGVIIAAGLAACGGGGGGGGGNQPPVAATVQNQVVLAGTAFTYTVPAYTDANSDTLTYTATKADGTALPAGLTFTPGDRTFSGTAQLNLSNPLEVKVTASDPSGGSAYTTFTFSSVNQGVYADVNEVTPNVGSQFWGVVFPASTGVAEVWTWEFDNNTSDYSKLYKGQLTLPASGTFATVAANRRTTNSSKNFMPDAAVVTRVSRGMNDKQNFFVGDSTYSPGAYTYAWKTNADFTTNDWQGSWVVKEQGTTITHVWTVGADGGITGSRKNGPTVICTVKTSSDASNVSLLSPGSPVSRIKVTENCGTDQSPDLQVWEGISFAYGANDEPINKRMLLLNGSGNTFMPNIACRAGTTNCVAP